MEESDFDPFIEEAGGQRLSEVIPSSPGFENADYWFYAHQVFAELKFLNKDQLGSPDITAKASKLYEEWLEVGKANKNIYGTVRTASDWLNEHQKEQIATLYKVPIGRVIRKCHSQIVDTKQHMQLPKFRGMCIIINTNNRAVTCELFKWILSKIDLLQESPEIESVLFLDRCSDRPFDERWLTCTKDKNANQATLALADSIRSVCSKFL